MTYKYLNDDGLKAYTKKVKGALKDLHTPIAISTLNTAESNAQNVRNITDFVAKAKAAGITDVDGMSVTCLLSSGYSGVGYLHFVDGNYTLQGVEIQEELDHSTCFLVWDDGSYKKTNLITGEVTSQMLTRGARKPIILTPETTEVDEETYQKLLSENADVIFKTDGSILANILIPTYNEATGVYYFTGLSVEGTALYDTYLYGYKVSINETAPHKVTIEELYATDIFTIIDDSGFINKSILSPVLKEIDLTGTDAQRKAKLDQFETDWKALTGASDLTGARFVGLYTGKDSNYRTALFIHKFNQDTTFSVYEGISMGSDKGYGDIHKNMNEKVEVNNINGAIIITPLFSHLESVEILTDNSAESKKKNLDNLNAYKSNLELLGVDTSIGFQVPIRVGMAGGILFRGGSSIYSGYFSHNYIIVAGSGKVSYKEVQLTESTELITSHKAIVPAINEVSIIAKAVRAFGAIELKASDNAANKAALTAYKKILTDAGISITNGYSVPVRITGNAQEYHGMLNIGTGALLSGIVTDANETHHYPFNVNTTDGAITFDANNYFLEKTSNEVTEMLDAIKYSYTPVSLTATTSTNKTQLDLFLSKVPNAQVMHCTYKDVYAGTLHKIGTDWFGLLVKNTNNYEDAIQVKLQADGTLVEGTTSLAQVNAKLANIIG